MWLLFQRHFKCNAENGRVRRAKEMAHTRKSKSTTAYITNTTRIWVKIKHTYAEAHTIDNISLVMEFLANVWCVCVCVGSFAIEKLRHIAGESPLDANSLCKLQQQQQQHSSLSGRKEQLKPFAKTKVLRCWKQNYVSSQQNTAAVMMNKIDESSTDYWWLKFWTDEICFLPVVLRFCRFVN